MAKNAKNNEKKVNNSTPNNAVKKESKKEKKDKKHFLKDVKAEMKKVIWPTKKQLINNTVAVIAIVLVIGIIVFLLDFCFEKINSFGIDKIKTIVQSSQNNETTGNVENEEVNSESTNELVNSEESVENVSSNEDVNSEE